MDRPLLWLDRISGILYAACTPLIIANMAVSGYLKLTVLMSVLGLTLAALTAWKWKLELRTSRFEEERSKASLVFQPAAGMSAEEAKLLLADIRKAMTVVRQKWPTFHEVSPREN